MNQWTPEIDERIWALRSSGHSNAATAEIIGRPVTHVAWRVHKIRARKGLTDPYGEGRPERPRSADPTPEQIAKAIAKIGFPERRPPRPPTWIQREIIRCRRMARKHGWAPRPAKKRKSRAA